MDVQKPFVGLRIVAVGSQHSYHRLGRQVEAGLATGGGWWSGYLGDSADPLCFGVSAVDRTL